MAVQPYSSLQLVKLQADIPLDDTQDDVLLNAALAATTGRINRKIMGAENLSLYPAAVAVARVYRANSPEFLTVTPICDDSSITVRTGTVQAGFTNLIDPGDWEALPLNATSDGEPVRTLRHHFAYWPTWPAMRVQVTAKPGFPAIPGAVIEAQTIWAVRLFDRRNSPQGIAGQAEMGPVRIGRTDPDIEAMLAPYCIPGFA